MSGGLSIDALSLAGPGGTRLVDEVSLEIPPGEILCLVGESGSGKSLTALAALGLLPPGVAHTAGTIRLGPERLAIGDERAMRAVRTRRIGFVFQEPATALNPVMRCGDQIEEVLEIHTRLGRTGRRARVAAMMEEVGLAEAGPEERERIARSFPHELSGGQRQRVMIAMALILGPEILIADEPTTALDVTTQKAILSLLKRLVAERAMGVLFVTHDFGVVAEIADRVAVMLKGRIVESGSASRVLETPQEAYTRRLLAAVPDLKPRAPDPHRQPVGPIVLSARGLAKTYRRRAVLGTRSGTAALREANLTLSAREILGLVGESGSGKSTAARCIARLETPSAGTIEVHGRDVAQASRRALLSLRRTVQIVFQDPYRSLNSHLSVGASMTEGPMNFGASRTEAEARARRLLSRVRIPEDAMARRPAEFSGGQRQRICIARALAMGPDILIADEAVSALDVSVQQEILELLKEIRDEFGLAILFITHDLRVAASLCDRIAVMHRGRIVETAPADQLLASPQEAYTRSLLAAVPGRHARFAERLEARLA